MSEQLSAFLPKLQSAFEDALGSAPELTLALGPADIPGWDSMGHVSLVNSIEEAFHLNLSIDEVMAMEDVLKIVEILLAKGAAPDTRAQGEAFTQSSPNL